MTTRKKIALIGAGNIGGTLAHLAMLKNLGEIVLLDVNEGVAKGKALDIAQSSYVHGIDSKIIGTSNYEDIKNSDVIIITAGFARKPGMSRDDLVEANTKVVADVARNVAKHSPDSFVICVTNPLDVMVWVFAHISKMPTHKIIGMAGVLDSARFALFLSQELNCSIADINVFVIGGHGDSMVPVVDYITVSGIPLPDLVKMGKISQQKVDQIVDRTRKGGAEIVGLLGNGSAFYNPAASAICMAESFLFDQKRLLAAAAFVEGKYNINGLYAGVPVIIGKGGAEEIVEINLNQEAAKNLQISIDNVKSLMETAKKFL